MLDTQGLLELEMQNLNRVLQDKNKLCFATSLLAFTLLNLIPFLPERSPLLTLFTPFYSPLPCIFSSVKKENTLIVPDERETSTQDFLYYGKEDPRILKGNEL